MTLKVDVILDHYGYYFQKTGLTLKDTNSEFSTARKFEETQEKNWHSNTCEEKS